MAIHPNENFFVQETLQPGARGETFVQSMPGFRGEEDRINRTNHHLNVSAHDVPNIKWELDSDRLPVLFRYGFAYGFNQIQIPKGRVVALDPNMSKVDFEMSDDEANVTHNVLTLANGGVPVRVRQAGDKYNKLTEDDDLTGIVSPDASEQEVVHVGKEWIPLIGMAAAYTDKYFRPFKTDNAHKQLADQNYTISEVSGRVVDENGKDTTVRVGNVPIGIAQRNEYTRDIDAYNGMMPGPVLTDAMIELPFFTWKDKAEANFWGSAYGHLMPGSLVKSDENGRLTASPLNDPEIVAAMNIAEYEAERRQVIGEVYSITKDLRPEGSAKWATWALEDRKKFAEFEPDVYRQTNRRGEDSINASPYASTGKYPGYPFDRAFNNSNLHLLGSHLRDNNYNIRMDSEYQYSNLGIPGLTDGYNAVVRDIPEETIGQIHKRSNTELPYIDQIMQVSEVNVKKGSLQVKFGNENYITAAVGQFLDTENIFEIVYVNEQQGLIKIHVADNDKADTYLDKLTDKVATVKAKFKKRGMAGVPTFMDWDGVSGSVKVLLTK